MGDIVTIVASVDQSTRPLLIQAPALSTMDRVEANKDSRSHLHRQPFTANPAVRVHWIGLVGQLASTLVFTVWPPVQAFNRREGSLTLGADSGFRYFELSFQSPLHPSIALHCALSVSCRYSALAETHLPFKLQSQAALLIGHRQAWE